MSPSEKSTPSGLSVPPVTRPADAPANYATDLADPGQFPFTRGIQADMYRGRLWTMRQYAGFGTAAETNARFRMLLDAGQTGLSVAFDLPTQMGIDSDSPRAAGEVGRVGVAIDTVDDMHTLLADLPLDRVSTSMTINATASTLLAMYIVVAEERGISRDQLSGTIQNDILKEYVARGTYIFPPEPSLALIADVFRFCAAEVPSWNPISISGYHMREAGATAVQELAFTFANAMEYVKRALAAGLDINSFAPRLSYFFAAHNDLFEEAAKYRAARVVWAEAMRNDYGAKNEASWKLRCHAQTAGCSLQDKQPELNLIRVAYQALAAVLGGCQSLHTNSMDEALALPSEHAVTLALRTQQILAYETGVTNTVDPLGGSYFVETLTNELKADAATYFDRIAAAGGMVAAIDAGFFRREIADAAFAYQREVDAQRKLIVGVNAFVEPDEQPLEVNTEGDQVEKDQIAALRAIKKLADKTEIERCLQELRRAAAGNQNLVGIIVEAARARASVEQIMNALADVFGRYQARIA